VSQSHTRSVSQDTQGNNAFPSSFQQTSTKTVQSIPFDPSMFLCGAFPKISEIFRNFRKFSEGEEKVLEEVLVLEEERSGEEWSGDGENRDAATWN
jgi:hypothetical protein